MTVLEFFSGFGGSANAFLIALKETGQVGKAKKRDGSLRAEPLVRGEGKENRGKAHAQTGLAMEGNGSWCMPLMNLSGLGSDKHRQAQPSG